MCHVNNKALIHLNCQYQHSLQSSIPITKTCKKWVMTLSSSMAMYSVMRDIPDARKVPMERGWVALYLYATCKFSNLLTLEQWAFEYGLPLFWYALYRRKDRSSTYIPSQLVVRGCRKVFRSRQKVVTGCHEFWSAVFFAGASKIFCRPNWSVVFIRSPNN